MSSDLFNFNKMPKLINIGFKVALTFFIVGLVGMEFLSSFNIFSFGPNLLPVFLALILIGILILIICVLVYFIGQGHKIIKINKTTNISDSTQSISLDNSKTPSNNSKNNCDDNACSSHNARYNEVCNYCGSKLDKNQSICSQCGHAQEIKCKKCGYINSSSNTYCTNCDNKLD